MIRTSSAPIIATAVSCLLFVAPASNVASAAEIKVLAPTPLKPAMVEVIQQFEKSSGYKVAVDYGTVGGLAGRLRKGEAADVVISLAQQIVKLEKQARIVEGSSVDIAKQGIGVFVRKGALKPDIGSVENFKRLKDYVATSAESDALSRDLKLRGFQFVGSTVCYAHMQATGMINDHGMTCFRRKEIINQWIQTADKKLGNSRPAG